MKYIKLFEFEFEDKWGHKITEFRFDIGDYVNLIDIEGCKDEISGASENILKQVFKIIKKSNIPAGKGNWVLDVDYNVYLLKDFDDKYFHWIKEDKLRSSTPREVEEAKINIVANKYNL